MSGKRPNHCERCETRIPSGYEQMDVCHQCAIEKAKQMEAELEIVKTTLRQIAQTPRNAGARRNASATLHFVETIYKPANAK